MWLILKIYYIYLTTWQGRVTVSAGSWQQQNVSAGKPILTAIPWGIVNARMKAAVRNTGVTIVLKAVLLLSLSLTGHQHGPILELVRDCVVGTFGVHIAHCPRAVQTLCVHGAQSGRAVSCRVHKRQFGVLVVALVAVARAARARAWRAARAALRPAAGHTALVAILGGARSLRVEVLAKVVPPSLLRRLEAAAVRVEHVDPGGAAVVEVVGVRIEVSRRRRDRRRGEGAEGAVTDNMRQLEAVDVHD